MFEITLVIVSELLNSNFKNMLPYHVKQTKNNLILN